MFAEASEEPQHVRNQVLSICDLKQTGDIPSARGCGRMVTMGNSLYLFGGVDEKTIFADLYVLEIGQMSWAKLEGLGDVPSGRFGHSFHAVGPDEIVLFGGYESDPDSLGAIFPFGPWSYKGRVSSDVYLFNTRTLIWRKFETKLFRVFQASCYDEKFNQLIVHGGYSQVSPSLVLSDEMFTLNLTSFELKIIHLSPLISPRAGHAICMHEDQVYLFGGDDTSSYCISRSNEVSTINEKGRTVPLGRIFHSFEKLNNGNLICFGGLSEQRPSLTDMYLYKDGWTKPLYEGTLSLRCHFGSVLGDKLMIFGGIKGEGVFTGKLFFQSILTIPNTQDGMKFKLVTVGDSGVGKSCLLTRFVSDVYNDFHISTIGVDYKTVVTMVKGKLAKLQLWDTAGQERFSLVTGNYYRGADGFVIVYDTTNRTSFEHVSQWMTQIRQHHDCGQGTVIILCANKQDLTNEIVVSETEGARRAEELGAIFVATSAKSSANVDLAFLSGAQRLVENRKTASTEHGVNLASRQSPRQTSQSNCCSV